MPRYLAINDDKYIAEYLAERWLGIISMSDLRCWNVENITSFAVRQWGGGGASLSWAVWLCDSVGPAHVTLYRQLFNAGPTTGPV